MPAEAMTPDEVDALNRATTALSGQPPSEDEVAEAGRIEALRFVSIIMNGRPHELRTLAPAENNRVTVQAGVYADPASLVSAAFEFDGATNVYVTLNPVSLEPVGIRRVGLGEAAKDDDVPEVRWLAIDIDRSKTEPDADPFSVVAEVSEYLCSVGFPEPAVLGSSANGYWLLYRITQPNTPETDQLRSEFLHALHERWPNVDVSVANPARICRLFGTLNLKGNKRSALLRPTTDDVEFPIVSDDLIRRVAATYDHPVQKDSGVRGDLEPVFSALEDRGIGVAFEKSLARGRLFQLTDCPFYPEDSHRSGAALLQWDDGNVAFTCRGGRCKADDNRILEMLHLLDLRAARADKAKGTRGIRAINVRMRAAEFAWGTRIVLSDLNGIVGDEKVGKGLLLAWLASEITTGRMRERPEQIMYCTTEESLDAMVVPRMAVAGADLGRIVLRPMGSVGLPDAIPDLISEMHDEGLAWLFLDGINKHFSDKYHPDNKRDVAIVLGELAQMAAENQITMVGSLHTNRGGGMTARERYAHSQEFRRSLRSAVLLGEVKGAPKGDRAIVHDFSNYTRLSPSLNATISAVALTIDDKPTEQPMLKVGEEIDVEAADLFLKEADREGAIKDAKEEHGLRGQCSLNIRGHWERMGRPREANRSDFAVVTKQFSDKVVQRARRSLGIESRDERDPDSNAIIGYIWVFPDEL